MRVYLDNNILVDIEDGHYKLKDFLSKPCVEYYYSDAHISELQNGVDKEISGLRERRLNTIQSICGKRFLTQDDSGLRVRLAECEPRQAYDNAVQFGFMRGTINRIVDAFTPNRQGILNELSWDAREVGSFKPDEILEKIEEKFLASQYHFGIKDYLRYSEASTGRTIFACLFNLLDMVGYRKDKNNVSRLYDATHAFYAYRCDALVSNDARMRLKTEAVYQYFRIKTRVMDAQSFLMSLD